MAPDIAYNLIDIIKEEYYRDLSLEPAQSFENALKAANEEFTAIAKEGEKDWIGKTNVTIAAIAGDKLMAVHRGTNELHLWRNGKLMHLSAEMYTPGEMPKPEETLTNIIEGDLLVGDKIIASTAELLYYFSMDKIKRFIEDYGPAEAARKLAMQLEKEGEISKTNVIIAEFSVPEMAIEEEGAPEDNWVGNITPDYGRKFSAETAATSRATTENLWGAAKIVVKPEPKWEADTEQPAAPMLNNLADRTSEMAQELDITEEMETVPSASTRRPISAHLPNIQLPKVNYARMGKGLSNFANKTRQVAKNPNLKKTGNVILRYAKYSWLILVAVVDLVFTSISYWVNEIKKQKYGNRILLISVGALAIVLVASTLTLANNHTTRVSRKVALASLDSAIQKRDAAKAALIYEDTTKAMALLAESYAAAESATKYDDTKKEALAVLADVQGQLDEVTKVKRYTNPRVTVDFAGMASQLDTSGSKTAAKVTIDNFFVIGSDIYSYDTDQNKVYKYNYSRNETGIINSLVSNEKKIKLGAPTDNGLVIYTTPPSIYTLDVADNKMTAANLDSGAWNNAVDLIAYTSKLYFLDPDNNQIWKYQGMANGYTKIAPFFEDNSMISLAGATAFAIDGDMYLLANGSVSKYTQGQKVEYTFNNLPEHTGALGAIKDIYASWNTNGLYILDATNNRVIAFNKDGKYRKQYILSGVTAPSKIFVDEKIGSFWVMSGTQVYQLDL